jgi:DNA polymerase-3 subunit delta
LTCYHIIGKYEINHAGEIELADEKPIIYIFHGEDEYAMKQAVDGLYRQLGEASIADMNTTRLDGRQDKEDAIRTAAATMPFLAERRLVILTHPPVHLKEAEANERFIPLLNSLPPSAALVLLVEDQRRFRGGGWQWEVISQKHWLRKWAEDQLQRAYIKEFPLPRQSEMPGWIMKRAAEQGGKFSREAAQELSSLIDNDTRIASQEITKLLTYVNFNRAVSPDDVDHLTAFSGNLSVFEMVDALAQGSEQKAMALLKGLLEQEDPISLFFMINRQFRLLIQAREILDEGGGEAQIQKELSVARFVAQKLNNQARRFELQYLIKIYHHLLEIDVWIKTGQMPSDLALELFVAEMKQ